VLARSVATSMHRSSTRPSDDADRPEREAVTIRRLRVRFRLPLSDNRGHEVGASPGTPRTRRRSRLVGRASLPNRRFRGQPAGSRLFADRWAFATCSGAVADGRSAAKNVRSSILQRTMRGVPRKRSRSRFAYVSGRTRSTAAETRFSSISEVSAGILRALRLPGDRKSGRLLAAQRRQTAVFPQGLLSPQMVVSSELARARSQSGSAASARVVGPVARPRSGSRRSSPAFGDAERELAVLACDLVGGEWAVFVEPAGDAHAHLEDCK
jgi:hypothetical protein